MHSYNGSFLLLAIRIFNIHSNIKKIEENDKKNPGMIEMEFLDDNEFYMGKFREELFKKIIISIELDGMNDIGNIFFLINELLKADFTFIFNLTYKVYGHFFQILEKNVFSEENNISREKYMKYYNYFIIFLTYILRQSFKPAFQEPGIYYPEFDYKIIFERVKRQSYLILDEQLIIYIPKILQTNFNAISKENKLGIHNIYLMD